MSMQASAPAKKTAAMDAFLGRRAMPRKPRAKTITPSKMSVAAREASAMMGTGDWSEAQGRHLVALFCLLHEKVYGVDSGMTSAECFFASGMAKQLMDRDFGGDPGALVAFVKWTWEREVSREKWRRENQKDGGSIGYRLQFGGRLVTDYKLAMARRAKT